MRWTFVLVPSSAGFPFTRGQADTFLEIPVRSVSMGEADELTCDAKAPSPGNGSG